MTFVLEGDILPHDVQTIAQVFFQNGHFEVVAGISETGCCLYVKVYDKKCLAAVYENGVIQIEKTVKAEDEGGKEMRRVLKMAIYEALNEMTGIRPSWGILTGIRPAKVMNELWGSGYSEEEAHRYLKHKFLVSDEKLRLCNEVAKAEGKILQSNNGKTASVYIGIPFCPTRCLYCSFTSYPVLQYGKYMDGYVDALIEEMRYIGGASRGFYIESIYIGGGTPTALDEKNLERLLAAVNEIFDVAAAKEFTVEAGRPDTINEEKLRLLKKHHVSRISINPQTLNQITLDKIGRKHSVDEFFAAYEMAKRAGHENINIDLILGLPDEAVKDVEQTFAGILALEPVSVTVHALAVKRASRLKETLADYEFIRIDEMERMLAVSSAYCRGGGLNPYYMYRQKNMVGNFENVGYCKPGFEGIYNVQIMEEKQTIFAAGAGAVTKVVFTEENRIERVFNVKSVEDYIGRTDEMIERKKNLFSQMT